MPGICPRCQKTVYFNEESIAMGKSFHKSCFSCANKSCNRKLNSGNLTTHDNELYCKICYGRLFGPKGYGVGVSVQPLDSDNNNGPIKHSGSPSSASNSKSPDETETETKPAADPQENKSNGTNGNGLTKINGSRSSLIPPNPSIKKVNITFDNFGNRIDICPRCNKQVYLAEKMVGGGRAWHKTSCFNCNECNKRLESTTLCEKEGEIYCKTCYAKQWGPSGYGHGINPGIRKVD